MEIFGNRGSRRVGRGTVWVVAVMRRAFEHEGLQRIQARCVAENAASARVMEKVGMAYEGTLHRYERIWDELRATKLYAIPRDERAKAQPPPG